MESQELAKYIVLFWSKHTHMCTHTQTMDSTQYIPLTMQEQCNNMTFIDLQSHNSFVAYLL